MPVEDRRLLAALVLAFAFGAALSAFIGARPARVLPNCLCGCPASAHEHNRPGTWCARCPRFGEMSCAHYEPNRNRPSWEQPELPTDDGDDMAAGFLRGLALATRLGDWPAASA